MIRSENALKEETKSSGAMVSALGAFEKQIWHLEAENVSLEEVSCQFMQLNLSALHSTFGKKLEQHSSIVLAGLPEIYLKVGQRLTSCLAKEKSELFTGSDVLV